MTYGVDIIVGPVSLNPQSAVSGNYGPTSLASGLYKRIESYDNDFADVFQIAPFMVGTGRAAVIILHK